jgi:hypothetical protein
MISLVRSRDDELIDGLDILEIEPHLISQTIPDNQDDLGDVALSAQGLARIFADFDSISDEEVDVVCAEHTVSGIALHSSRR